MKLKELRLEKGMSQSQLAKAAGVNLQHLQHCEQGNRDINGAKLSMLIKLAIALECKIQDIIDNELADKLKEVV